MVVVWAALILLPDGECRFRGCVFSKLAFPGGKTPLPSLSLPLPGSMSSGLVVSVVSEHTCWVLTFRLDIFSFLLSKNNVFLRDFEFCDVERTTC